MKFDSQKEATFYAVTTVFTNNKIKYEVGKTDFGQQVTRGSEIRKQIIGALVEIFTKKEAPLERAQTDLPKYCSGLLNNWLRRDERLNGGKEYKPDVGANDEQIREMTKLLAAHPEAAAKINEAIDKRRQEVIASRKVSKAPTIDASKLPEHLRKLVA